MHFKSNSYIAQKLETLGITGAAQHSLPPKNSRKHAKLLCILYFFDLCGLEMTEYRLFIEGKSKAAFKKAAQDPRLVELVKFLARKAAEKDHELILKTRDTGYNPPHSGGRK